MTCAVARLHPSMLRLRSRPSSSSSGSAPNVTTPCTPPTHRKALRACAPRSPSSSAVDDHVDEVDRSEPSGSGSGSGSDASECSSSWALHVDGPYPKGDWRNGALRETLGDRERERREAMARHYTYMLKVQYDGEAYLGFQYQPPPRRTVQGEIEKALTKLTGGDRDFLGIQASGRTDTGVHARGQVLHFYTRRAIPDLSRFQRSMNGVLPDDVRVVETRRPHPAFHARFHAVRKTYHYYLDARPAADPFTRRYALHVGWRPPDMDRLRAAAAVLVGTHDFSAFANKSRDKNLVRDPVRTIYRFDVVEEGELIRLEVEGSGFLYRGVRNMVGALLVASSSKKMGPENLRALLEGRDRKAAPMGAPAHGLFLHEVVYPQDLLDWTPPPGYDAEVEAKAETSCAAEGAYE